MKQGKVSEVVLKRSVFKNISSKNQNVVKGIGIGADSSIININGEKIAVSTSGVVDYAANDKEYYTFYRAYNSMLASGFVPISLTLNIIMPIDEKEKNLKEIVRNYDALCKKHHMQICGGHTQYTRDVNQIITSITLIGSEYPKKSVIIEEGREHDIVMTKAMGIEGTAIISRDKEDVLQQKFNGTFCRACLEFKNYISIEKEAKIAMDYGAARMHDVSGGGIFGAIWELASSFNMGAEIDLRKITVWQETIEVTELFDMNPYKMTSSGSLLIATDDGEALVEKLIAEGVQASVIGKLAEGNDKVIWNHDEKRFLEPPRTDEIYKIERQG